MHRYRMVFLLVLQFVLVAHIAAQSIDSAILDFTQKTQREDNKEVLKGTMYFSAPDFFSLFIDDPINQHIFMRDEETLFYYPDRNYALRMPRKSKSALHMSSQLQSIIKKDMGLSAIGYEIVDIKPGENGGVVSTWQKKNQQKDSKRTIILHTDNKDRITKRVELNSEKKPLIKVLYSNFSQKEGAVFPSKIISKKYDKSGDVVIVIEVTFSNINFNIKIPTEIINFELPENSTEKVINW